MDLSTLGEARRNLIAVRLVTYEKPIYQVLSLDPSPDYPRRTPLDPPLSIAQIFKQMMGGAK